MTNEPTLFVSFDEFGELQPTSNPLQSRWYLLTESVHRHESFVVSNCKLFDLLLHSFCSERSNFATYIGNHNIACVMSLRNLMLSKRETAQTLR